MFCGVVQFCVAVCIELSSAESLNFRKADQLTTILLLYEFKMDNNNDIYVLDEEVYLSDLLKGGVVMSFESEIAARKTDKNYEEDFFDPAAIEGDFVELGAPGQYTFKEISTKMIDVGEDGLIKKLVIKSGYGEKITEGDMVQIHYNAFWEGESISFDSSYLRGETKKFTIGEGEVIPGLEEATKTMVQGEQAQFLINYRLLFGERGCLPRVKPKADGLFNIEVVRVIAAHTVTALDKEEQEEASFLKILACAKSLHVSGKEAVKKNNINAAIKFFFKAVRILESARLSREEEQADQQKLLLLLFTNLAVCYNKLDNPKRACCMCNEISRITNINNHCKALYQNAVAVQKLGDYQRARVLFNKALKLKPNNTEIGCKLAALETMVEKQEILERQMCSKMLNMQVEPQKENNTVEVPEDFQNEVTNIIESFSSNNTNQLILPPLLSSDEIKFIENLIHSQGYNMVVQQSAEKYYIKKI